MKNCPYCAEEIQDEAIKCKHCKAWLKDISELNSDHLGPTPPSSNGVSIRRSTFPPKWIVWIAVPAVLTAVLVYVIIHKQISITKGKPPETVATMPALPQEKKKSLTDPSPPAGIQPPLPARAKDIFSYPDGHFSFTLPSGWKRIPDNIVDEYADKLYKESKGKIKSPKYDIVFNRKEASWPFAYPYFMIKVWKMHIDEAEISNIVSTIQKDTQKIMKEGYLKELYKDSLVREPIYDKQKRIILYSADSKIKSFENKDIYITMIVAIFFFKDGAISVNFYSNTKSINNFKSDIDTILDSFSIDDDFKYKP